MLSGVWLLVSTGTLEVVDLEELFKLDMPPKCECPSHVEGRKPCSGEATHRMRDCRNNFLVCGAYVKAIPWKAVMTCGHPVLGCLTVTPI